MWYAETEQPTAVKHLTTSCGTSHPSVKDATSTTVKRGTWQPTVCVKVSRIPASFVFYTLRSKDKACMKCAPQGGNGKEYERTSKKEYPAYAVRSEMNFSCHLRAQLEWPAVISALACRTYSVLSVRKRCNAQIKFINMHNNF